jgi:hypothetical protein
MRASRAERRASQLASPDRAGGERAGLKFGLDIFGLGLYPGIVRRQCKHPLFVPPRFPGSVRLGSRVVRLLDLKELAQIIGANHADLADFDEREPAVTHQIIELGAAQSRSGRCIVDSIREGAALFGDCR